MNISAVPRGVNAIYIFYNNIINNNVQGYNWKEDICGNKVSTSTDF